MLEQATIGPFKETMMTLEQRIGYQFNDPALLEQALTHKSYFNENSGACSGHNERFEFLGDAVLDLCISDLLMKAYPESPEGELSKYRAGLVNETTLAQFADEYGLPGEIRLGKGELNTGGSSKPRLQASVFEALIGAYYLDAGFEVVSKFIESVFKNSLVSGGVDRFAERDYKTRFQELIQERFRQAPEYELLSQTGPDHEKTFQVAVKVNGEELAQGTGRSKKHAEQNAAQNALEKL